MLTQTLQKQHVKHPMSWIGHPSVSSLDNQDIFTSKDSPTNLVPLLGDTCKDYSYASRAGNKTLLLVRFHFQTNLFVRFQGCFLFGLGFRVYDLLANQKGNALADLLFKV